MKFKLFYFLIIFIAITAMDSYSQDKRTDHPALSRYEGAELTAWQRIDYAPYVLGIGLQEQKDEDFRGHRRYFSEYIDLEGKITRIQYMIPKEEGIFKVYKNYENALESSGYQVLFVTSEKESSYPFWNEEVYHSEWGINALQGEEFEDPFGRDGFRYIAAKGTYKGDNIYFALFINKEGGEHVMVTQDIIEVNPMESGLVTAKKIEDNIRLSGFVSIYGVHFDTGKWNIKEESKPALKEIASYLKEHPENKYYIVGHTDNVGDFASNKTLSENRAKAVMTELIDVYGVNESQLEAYGVASLSPVTSNSTEEGKARNRRVEIVEQ